MGQVVELVVHCLSVCFRQCRQPLAEVQVTALANFVSHVDPRLPPVVSHQQEVTGTENLLAASPA